MRRRIPMIMVGAFYAFIHFSVEVACFYFLFARLSGSPLWWGFAMLFDALAFLPQSFLGLLQDCFPRFKAGPIGCLLILVALLIPHNVAALMLIGFGNALVHIDGAEKTLDVTEGRITPCGIFVGGGSFGVVAGQLLGTADPRGGLWIPLFLILFSGILTGVIPLLKTEKSEGAGFAVASEKPLGAIVFMVFIVVAVRAYIAYAIPTEWNKTPGQAVLLFISMGIGKMMGGLLADWIGYRKTALISLLAGLPFLLFGNSVIVVSLIGVGLFSMTMPITIALLVSRFPTMPCFSFGITTVALFAGTLPAFFVRPEGLLMHQMIVLVLSLIAGFILLFSIKKGV